MFTKNGNITIKPELDRKISPYSRCIDCVCKKSEINDQKNE